MSRQRKQSIKVNRLPKIDENEHNTNSYQEINNKIENISIQMENNILSRRSPNKRNNYLKEQQQCQSPAPSSPKDTSNDSFMNHIALQKEEKEDNSLPMSYHSQQQQQPKQKKKVHIDTTNLLKKYEHNSDEDEEFDWFEDDRQQDKLKRSKSSIRRAKHKNIKQPCCWHYLTPYMKRFLICFIGSFTFIIIAILAHIYLPEGTIQQQNDPNFKNYYIDIRSYVVFLIVSAWNVGIWSVFLNVVFKESTLKEKEKKEREMSVKNQHYTEVIREIYAFIFFSAVFLFVQKLISVVLRTKFFMVAYADRIKNNRFKRKVLDRLSKIQKKATKANRQTKSGLNLQNSTSSSYFGISNEEAAFTSGYNSQPRVSSISSAIPTTSSSSLMSPISPFSPVLTELDTMHSNTSKSTIGSRKGFTTSQILKLQRAMQKYIITDVPEKYHNLKRDDVGATTKHSARKLAKKLFYTLAYPNGVPAYLLDGHGKIINSFVGGGSVKMLTLNHFRPFFKTEQEAEEAFLIFDRDGNGDISRREFRDTVVEIYDERRLLCEGLHDTSQALGKVDIFIFIVFLLIDLFVSLLVIFHINLYQILLPLSTFILGISFMFADTAKVFFQSILYLFLTHPYDVGDKVVINNVTMIVNYMGILATIFVTTNGVKVYVPTTELFKANIINIRRSPAMGESINIHIDFRTPTDVIFTLNDRLTEWIAGQPRDFVASDFSVRIQTLTDCNKIELTMWLPHKTNWQTFLRSRNKNRFLFFLKDTLHDLHIHYELPAIRLLSRSVYEDQDPKSMIMSDAYDKPTLHRKLFKNSAIPGDTEE
ncbi:Mechanosensitive ion channel-domain-containing protein [Cunninghamella echinulata]|nr:Mechanosensitive ion channel-domain-containing protein [Cunninghamella echinulata]